MKKIINLIILGILIISCSTKNYTYYYTNFDLNKRLKIFSKVPNNYVIITKNKEEKNLIYKDSSIIFFSFDNLGGSRVNRINRIEKDIEINRKTYNDTLILEGVNNKNLYWKECFFDDIVVGYLNVSLNNKNKYDNFIKSIKRTNK